MELSDILVLFIIGFVFGLTVRLLYGMVSGSLRRKSQVPKAAKNVRYISPKSDEGRSEADRGQDTKPSRRASNQ